MLMTDADDRREAMLREALREGRIIGELTGDIEMLFERLDEARADRLKASAMGWTLGPRIDDLLLDAARYRWLRDRGANGNADEVEALIDAEIAREKGCNLAVSTI